MAYIKTSESRLEPSDLPFLSSSAFNTTVEEISEDSRSELEMESVRLAKKLFVADWSGSELSSKETLEENTLEISSSEVIPSITLRPEKLLLPQF